MEQPFSTVQQRAQSVSFTDPQKFTRSQKFISKFRRKFKEGCQFYNPDTTLMPKEDYLTADLRVLIFFNAPYSVKGSSQTCGALNSFVKEICNASRTAEQNAIIEPKHSNKVAPEPHARGPLNVFVDFCYLPEASDLKLYDRYNMPYAIGNATHLDASYYDVVGFSIAILHEVCTTPLVISTFDRCDYQIPLTWTERKSAPFNQYPLIYAGGITASCGEIMFGDLGDGRTAFVDGLYLGGCEKMDLIFERAIEAKRHNEAIERGEAVQPYAHDEVSVSDIVSIEDFYNSLFDIPWFYQPQAYKVVYDDRNLIVENTKINPHAQDFVEPYYPKKIHDDYLGIAMSVINANGDSTGRCESQVSEGSLIKGTLLRTSKGLVPIEEFCKNPNDYAEGEYPLTETTEGLRQVDKTWIQGIKPAIKFNLQYGFELASSEDHPIEVINEDGTHSFKEAKDIKVGDTLILKSNSDFIKSLNGELEEDDDRYWSAKFFGKSFWDKMWKASSEFVSVEEMAETMIWGINRNILSLIDDSLFADIVSIPKELLGNTISYESENAIRQWVIENKSTFHDKARKYYTYEDDETGEEVFDLSLEEFESEQELYDYVDDVTEQIVKYNGGYYDCESEEAAAYNQQYFLCYGYVFGREGNKLWFEGYDIKSIKVESIEQIIEAEHFDITVPDVEKYVANGISVHNCSAQGICAFCHEGSYTGGYVEKTFERNVYEARQAKKYAAASRYSPFSFNTNYVTDWKGYLYEMMKLFSKISIHNQRMEELGKDVDAIRMAKYMGANHLAAPLEGVSPRIQNNILNKCLSEESITNIMEYAIHGKTSEIKVGGILCGMEQPEDWQWLFDFSDRLQAKAKAEGGNLKFRMNFTPLVCYPLTVCEYFPRISAHKSFYEERWFTSEFVEEFKKRGIRTKIHGSRGSNFAEHCLVDLGRSITPWLYNFIVKPQIPVYSLRSLCYSESIEWLRKNINEEWYFKERDPKAYISPSHRLFTVLRPALTDRAERFIELYRQGRPYDMEPDIRCIKTYEGAKTKCYSRCLTKNPLKIYYDVKLVDGHLEGTYRESLGCERCDTKEEKLARLNREIKSTKNSQDILAYPKPRPVLRLRFVLQRHKPYDIMNPRATAHTFMAKILTLAPEELTDYFHMVENHSNYWSALPKTPYYFSGIQVVDVLFLNRKAYDIVKAVVPEANKVLKATTILSVYEEFIDDRIKVDDYNVFKFTTTLPADAFRSASLTYKGEIKVEHEDQIVMVKDPELMAPQFLSKGATVTGVVVLPCRYNPALYLSAFLNQQNVSVPAVNETTEFENLMVVRKGSNVCRQCNNEPGFLSLVSGKELPFGYNCLAKALIRKFK